jgi:hypothetical protein
MPMSGWRSLWMVLRLGTLSLNASRDFVKTANEHHFPVSETAGWQIPV